MTITNATNKIFDIINANKSEYNRYGMIHVRMDNYIEKEVRKILKPFSKKDIEAIFLLLISIDPMMNFNELILTFAGWLDTLSIITINAYAIRMFLVKTRRVPENAYTHLSKHPYGTLTVQSDAFMIQTLERIDVSILKSHIQSINKEARPIKAILGKSPFVEIPELYFKMYELANEPLLIKDGKHFGLTIPHPTLEKFIQNKQILLKDSSSWLVSLRESGNDHLYQLLVENGYVKDLKTTKNQSSHLDATKKRNDIKPIVLNTQENSYIPLKEVIQSVKNKIQSSIQDESLIDLTFSELYVLKDGHLTIYDQELLSSIRKKPQEFRHVTKALKESIDFVRLCSILAPTSYTYFLKKVKEYPLVLEEVIKFSHSTYLFYESTILDNPSIQTLIKNHFYNPSMNGSNVFYISNHYPRKPAQGLNVMAPLYTKELILEAIQENPLVYYVFKHIYVNPKNAVPGLFSQGFWDQMKHESEQSAQLVFHTLKSEIGFDFYNYVGRKKGIKDFKKSLQTAYKTKTFKEALEQLDDEALLEQLVVKSELSNDSEIIPLMYLQEKVTPSKNILPILKTYLEGRTYTLLKRFYPNKNEFGNIEYMTSLRGWNTSYACTIAYITDHFEVVMNQKVLVPLHHLNMLEKPSFDVGSLYGG